MPLTAKDNIEYSVSSQKQNEDKRISCLVRFVVSLPITGNRTYRFSSISVCSFPVCLENWQYLCD